MGNKRERQYTKDLRKEERERKKDFNKHIRQLRKDRNKDEKKGDNYGYYGYGYGKREADAEADADADASNYGAVAHHTTGPQCQSKTERKCHQVPQQTSRPVSRQVCHP